MPLLRKNRKRRPESVPKVKKALVGGPWHNEQVWLTNGHTLTFRIGHKWRGRYENWEWRPM